MVPDSNAYEKGIKWRIRFLFLAIIAIAALVIYISLNGGGDSRVIPKDILSFGSLSILIALIYLITRIGYYKRVLKDKYVLQLTMNKERDERGRLIHERSGGDVWTVIFVVSVLVTVISAEYDKNAFFSSFAILCFVVIIKLSFYLYFRFTNREK